MKVFKSNFVGSEPGTWRLRFAGGGSAILGGAFRFADRADLAVGEDADPPSPVMPLIEKSSTFFFKFEFLK